MDNDIKCPNCGWEYLPGEIYLPKQFLGQPRDVERSIEGEILNYYGDVQNLKETYRCDHCSKFFDVTANVSFSTKVNIEHNLDDEFTQPLYGKRIHLSEG